MSIHGLPPFTAEMLAAADVDRLAAIEQRANRHAEAVEDIISLLDDHYGARGWTRVTVSGSALEREVLVDLIDADLATVARVRAERADRARGLTV